MTEYIRRLLRERREVIMYLVFGGLTTLVNFAGFKLLRRAAVPVETANALALAISILFAYVTNRRFVFESRARGAAAWREFAKFICCRLGTALLDEAIMVVGVKWLGPKLVSEARMDLFESGVKLFAQVVVVVSNYVLSRRMVFTGKE